MVRARLHELRDRDRLRPLYEHEPLLTVRARSILFGLRLPNVRMLVDDPTNPRGALLSADGLLWDAYSPDPQVARDLLDLFDPGRRVVFFGLPVALLDHVRRSFHVLVETPATLYVLPTPSDFRPATLAGDSPVELSSVHAAQLSDAWTVHDFESPEARLAYVRPCLERGPSAAVVHDGRPVSFVLTHADGSVGILHTDPAFRRQGFGRRVLSALVENLLRRGREVFAYVAGGNLASIALMEATGLRPVQETAVITVGGRR